MWEFCLKNVPVLSDARPAKKQRYPCQILEKNERGVERRERGKIFTPLPLLHKKGFSYIKRCPIYVPSLPLASSYEYDANLAIKKMSDFYL